MREAIVFSFEPLSLGDLVEFDSGELAYISSYHGDRAYGVTDVYDCLSAGSLVKKYIYPLNELFFLEEQNVSSRSKGSLMARPNKRNRTQQETKPKPLPQYKNLEVWNEPAGGYLADGMTKMWNTITEFGQVKGYDLGPHIHFSLDDANSDHSPNRTFAKFKSEGYGLYQSYGSYGENKVEPETVKEEKEPNWNSPDHWHNKVRLKRVSNG